MAYYQDQLAAPRTVSYFGNHAADIHVASSSECRNLGPSYLLALEAMKCGKTHGCHIYDLWDIPDESGQAGGEGKDLSGPDRTDGL